MIESKTFTVDGVEYRVSQFGAHEGQTMLVRLARIVGPAFGRGANGIDADINFGAAIEHFFEKVTPSEFADIAKKFAEQTEVNIGDDKWVTLSGVYNNHFAGQYGNLLKWLKGAIEANYGTFFSGLKMLPGLLAKTLAETLATLGQASKSPGSSTGHSGG